MGKELDRRRAAQEGEQSLAAPEEGDPSQAPSSSLTHVAAALSQVGSEMMEDISQQRAALRTISAPTYEASLPSQRQVDQGGQPAPSGETRGSLSESHQIPETVGSVSALAPSQDVIYDNVSASAPVEDLENADSQPVYALATRDPEEVQRAADDRAGYIRVEGKGSGVFAGDELKKELMEAASLMAERRENKALSQELPFAPGDLPNVPSSGRDENTH